MAGCALLRRCVSSIDNILRLVSLVALLAVSGTLIGRVSLVALSALWNLAMHVMAEGTGQFGMLARVSLELGNLR